MASMTRTDVVTYSRERPGMSAFVLEDGVVYHTYSSYSHGADALWGMCSGSTGRSRGAKSFAGSRNANCDCPDGAVHRRGQHAFRARIGRVQLANRCTENQIVSTIRNNERA